jgi:hypothetical protein
MEIDLRIFPLATVDSKIAAGHDLLGWAIKFGKVLFQRDHYWETIINAWQQSLPLTSGALSRKRAVAARERLAKVLLSADAAVMHEQAVSYLTHLARTELLEHGVYPASRPDLPSQLRAINRNEIAEQLERFLQESSS